MMGIVSYGDLSANFLGLQFWQSVLDRSDLLNTGPYLVCNESGWQQIKKYDFSVFLNDALDEGINCNHITNKKLKKFVESNIVSLEDKRKKNFTCPIDLDSCKNLVHIFKEYSPYIINPNCL